MFLGTYQLGDIVPISVWTLSGTDVPTVPDDAPVVRVYQEIGQGGPPGSLVTSLKLPIADSKRTTGYFLYRLNLGPDFEAGRYAVNIVYVLSGTSYGRLFEFEIVPGGDDEGSGIAIHFFKPPKADYVLLQTDHGKLKRLRTPSIRGI